MFPNELHTQPLYFNIFNQHSSWALPNLRAVNPPPANNPELLLTKLSVLPWIQRAALLTPSHAALPLCPTLILSGWRLSSPSSPPPPYSSSLADLLPSPLSPKPGKPKSPASLCPTQTLPTCWHLYLQVRPNWGQGPQCLRLSGKQF